MNATTINHIPVDAILTIVYVCLPIFFALLALYYSFCFLKTARALEDTPTSKIRSAAQGYIELTGNSASLIEPPVFAKLTQKPCAWYSYTIEKFNSKNLQNNNTAYWELVEQNASFIPFILKDNTGECIILAEKAQMIPNATTIWRGPSETPKPPPTSFWARFFWFNLGRFRYIEHRIELNIPLYATGQFCTWEGNNESVKKNTILSQYIQKNNLKTINVMTKPSPGTNHTPYIISTVSEKLLVKRLKIKSFLSFIAFLFFTIIIVHSSFTTVKESLKNWSFKIQRSYNWHRF